MAFRFKPHEAIGAGVQRVGIEQLERALTKLRSKDAVAGVHETRKCLKRLRALLRLVRSGLEPAQYRTLNVGLRDAGRLLSQDRDLDVLIAIVQVQVAHGEANWAGWRRLKGALIKRRQNGGEVEARKRRGEAHMLIEEVRTAWPSLALEPDTFEPLADGLAAGMVALAESYAATAGGGDEAFHDLRKAVQRHWRQMRLVQAGWPDYFEARANAAREISDLLGRAQDQTLLIGCLEGLGSDALPPKVVADLAGEVEAKRARVREAALAHAERLVVEGARGHARRAGRYWSVAARIGDTSVETDEPAAAAKPGTRRVSTKSKANRAVRR